MANKDTVIQNTSPKLPKVQVFNKTNPVKSKPGLASKIALIGAFEPDIATPVLCASLDEAYEKLGTNKEVPGVSCLEHLFYGASSVLAVNITTKTGSGSNITIDASFSPAKLTSALSKISGEDFDILYIAVPITSELIPIIIEFLNNRFLNKMPSGYVCYGDFDPALSGDFCYGHIHQQLIINGTLLSTIESGAYYCGVIASLNVGNSMTMKVVPNVTGIEPELTFENGSVGAQGLNLGVTLFKCLDRGNDVYVVVNSEQPNGFDLYINRTRDFVVKEMSLHQFLGERNRQATLNEIKQEVDRVKERCVNTLDLLEDIEYNVEKKSPNCVDINITKLLFAGIITEIDVYITIKVE